jgi:DNA-binding transcriptional MerR regulator/DNA-directed RNA polymerase subunit RPC12/RpoP
VSQYTTGELAKLCYVTVRTVQYYDNRGILTPSALSEGGRRLYSDADLKKMKTICFLRELGFSIDSISKLFAEENDAKVISLLLEQQEAELKTELEKNQEKLDRIIELKKEIGSADGFSVESIFDIADTMENKKKLRKFRITTLLIAIPLGLLEIGSIVLWCYKGIWWPCVAVYVGLAIPFGIIFSKLYYQKIDYICPECHEQFKPRFREMFSAKHTPKTRKLVCPKCGKKSFCVETWGGK